MIIEMAKVMAFQDRMRKRHKGGRFEYMTVSKYSDNAKIQRASNAMDIIRKEVSSKKSPNMTDIVREWRGKRYASRS